MAENEAFKANKRKNPTKQKLAESSYNPKKNPKKQKTQVHFNLIVPILVQIALLMIEFHSFSQTSLFSKWKKKNSFLDGAVLEEKHVFGNVFIYIVSKPIFLERKCF